MNATSIGKETWNQLGPGVIEITQYGFRLPNGDERWGDLTTESQQAKVNLGNEVRQFAAAPYPSYHGLEQLREYARSYAKAGLVPVDEAATHAERIVRIERNVMVAIAATTDHEEK